VVEALLEVVAAVGAEGSEGERMWFIL